MYLALYVALIVAYVTVLFHMARKAPSIATAPPSAYPPPGPAARSAAPAAGD